MEIVRQVRMVIWGFFLTRRIKLLLRWIKSPNEDTRTIAYMLLSVMASEANDAIEEMEYGG